MKKFKITYTSKTDGDCTSVWLRAESKEDAVREVRREYWDVARVICVEEI